MGRGRTQNDSLRDHARRAEGSLPVRHWRKRDEASFHCRFHSFGRIFQPRLDGRPLGGCPQLELHYKMAEGAISVDDHLRVAWQYLLGSDDLLRYNGYPLDSYHLPGSVLFQVRGLGEHVLLGVGLPW